MKSVILGWINKSSIKDIFGGPLAKFRSINWIIMLLSNFCECYFLILIIIGYFSENFVILIIIPS